MIQKKILILGLPGAGKTTLASKLVPLLNAKWLNADKVRRDYNDWDFSEEGRSRQAIRMNKLAQNFLDKGHIVVADFVCPTPKLRKLFDPEFIIWVNTIKAGRFDDTNKLFIEPKNFDFEVKTKDADKWSLVIADKLKGKLK
jgi:adenylylsulfate kinase